MLAVRCGDEPDRLRSGRSQVGSGPTAAAGGGVCALWRGGACRALHRAYAQPARTAGAAAAALGETSAAAATGGPRAAHRLEADRVGFRIPALAVFDLLESVLWRRKPWSGCTWARRRLCGFLGEQSVSAHHGDEPPQPARGRLGLRAICVPGGGGAVCRRGAEAVSCCAAAPTISTPIPAFRGACTRK